MKNVLALSLLCSLIVAPVFGALTTEDLEKIRQIVKESEAETRQLVKETKAELKADIDTLNTKIDGLDTRLRTVETGVAELRGRRLGFFDAQGWILAGSAVAALVISIIALRRSQPKVPESPQDTRKAVSQ